MPNMLLLRTSLKGVVCICGRRCSVTKGLDRLLLPLLGSVDIGVGHHIRLDRRVAGVTGGPLGPQPVGERQESGPPDSCARTRVLNMITKFNACEKIDCSMCSNKRTPASHICSNATHVSCWDKRIELLSNRWGSLVTFATTGLIHVR